MRTTVDPPPREQPPRSLRKAHAPSQRRLEPVSRRSSRCRGEWGLAVFPFPPPPCGRFSRAPTTPSQAPAARDIRSPFFLKAREVLRHPRILRIPSSTVPPFAHFSRRSFTQHNTAIPLSSTATPPTDFSRFPPLLVPCSDIFSLFRILLPHRRVRSSKLFLEASFSPPLFNSYRCPFTSLA